MVFVYNLVCGKLTPALHHNTPTDLEGRCSVGRLSRLPASLVSEAVVSGSKKRTGAGAPAGGCLAAPRAGGCGTWRGTIVGSCAREVGSCDTVRRIERTVLVEESLRPAES